MKATACTFGLVTFAACLAAGLAAQPAASPPPSHVALSAIDHGWYVSYDNADAAGKVKKTPSATAIDAYAPDAAFLLKSGETVHPAIKPAGLTARFDGVINIPQPGKYRFGADVAGGSVQLLVFGGKLKEEIELNVSDAAPTPLGGAMSKAVQMPAGEVNIQYTFIRKGEGEARLRAVWEMQGDKPGDPTSGFRREPIPARMIAPPRFRKETVQKAELTHRGRVLLGELNCTACHAAEPTAQAALLKRTAPKLDEIGTRASPTWLARWVNAPQDLKPGSPMPDVFTDKAKDKADADAIVCFLTSLQGKQGAFDAESSATETETIDLGRNLYQSVGCVACHETFAAEGPAAAHVPMHSLGDVAGKWRPSALADFLNDPLATRPGGRMPYSNLTKAECDLIATFLLKAWADKAKNTAPTPEFKPDATKIDTGRTAFSTRGCINCHELEQKSPAAKPAARLASKPLSKLRAGRGCLDPKDTKSPRYSLTADDSAAITAALAESARWTVAANAPTDHALLTIDALSCRACHEYGGIGGVAADINHMFQNHAEADLGDEGRLPPKLSGVGFKLSTDWLRTVFLQPEGAGAARPYLNARMPQFGKDQVGMMPEWLAAVDGIKADTDIPEPKATDELIVAGKTLAGAGQGGFNCISCHVVGDHAPAGTPGPAITDFAQRLRYEWFSAYIHAPDRFKPGTKMPALLKPPASGAAAPGGTAPSAAGGGGSPVLGGNTDKQEQALWSYFNLGEFMPVPEGITTGRGLAIRVGDRPIVMRTFLKSAGSRGIAIGFPVGVHFAFDAERVRLTEAWHGDFLDASGAWAGRGGNIVGGMGPPLWTAPAGPAIVIGAKPAEWPKKSGSEEGYHFKGYRLDSGGVPTFMYRIGDKVAVEETDQPFAAASVGGDAAAAKPKIMRAFKITGLDKGQTMWVNAGGGAPVTRGVQGAEVSEAGGAEGAKWFGFTSGGGDVSFSIEIAP